MNKQNRWLFILGAPKCGTSSLFGHLTLHPAIFGTKPKETYALLPDSHPLAADRVCKGLDQIHQLAFADSECFAGKQPTADAVILEGTTHHLYSDLARNEIARLGETARVVVMVRKPSQRVLSSFLYTKQNLARVPSDFSFEKYVRLLLENQKEEVCRRITHPLSGPILADDLWHSDYAVHLEKWLQSVAPERLRVIISEQYFRNSNQVAEDLCQWLGIDPKVISQLSNTAKNPTRKIGATAVHRLAWWVNQRAPLPRVVKDAYFGMQTWLARGAFEEVDDSLRMLDSYFLPRITAFEDLLGMKVPEWNSEIQS